ncbi:Cell division protein FtsZ [Gallibacterium anatis]|uniref:Cell division protein FtsZ n=1 Tax=Gallibacterium anatis TaxID=750 RepID=A0A377H487_9PAST|nr:cell division protein FtsZ [Gallibacterium anatis]KGQ56502.1 cell division protein FtsZ [Gallibacterium anatis DSM 16844 = F 149]STO37289.1 Cell division protein FtsZ [Gallibacterium anatis]
MLIEPIIDETTADAVIKVIGVGGGGGNALNHMVQDEFKGVEFFSVNTDAQALRKSLAQQTIQIGAEITKGLGAGAKPEVGRQAAEEDREALRSMLEGADMVFIAAGMGGGTGTGAAPIIAEVAKELGILTVAVVTKPFKFEGKKRMQFAESGIQELAKYVDSLITIPNDKLLKVLGKNISFLEALAAANDVLRNAVRGISDIITSPGFINVDFADVKTVMSEMGYAMMGTGIAIGEVGDGRAEKAAQDAIASPLLEDIDISGAKGVLVNITTSGFNFGLGEFEAVGETIHAFAAEDATVVIGTSVNPELPEDELRVTIVATGIGGRVKDESQIKIVSNNTQAQDAKAKQFAYNMPPLGEATRPDQFGARTDSTVTSTSGNAVKKPALDESKLFDLPTFLRDNAN